MSDRRRAWALIGCGVLGLAGVAVGIVGVTGGGAAWWWLARQPTADAPPVVAEAEAPPSDPPEPAAPEPVPPEPAPVDVAPAPEPAAPAPVAPAPPPAPAPAPVAAARPAPSPAPAPARAVPASPAARAAPPGGVGTVVATGAAQSVTLIDDIGARYPLPTRLPSGTYGYEASFGGRKVTGTVVTHGATVLVCASVGAGCVARD